MFIVNTNVELPTFVMWENNGDVSVSRCPNCKRTYVSGDSRTDYNYKYCPHCGNILIKFKESED